MSHVHSLKPLVLPLYNSPKCQTVWHSVSTVFPTEREKMPMPDQDQ